MTTKIYGTSDDLIEIEGDVDGEVGCYGAQEEGQPGVLLICSDGTLLTVKYGRGGLGVWDLTVIQEGALYSSTDICNDEDAQPYSDVVHFRDGLKWVIQAMDWKRVK